MTKVCSNPECGKEKDISEFSYRKNRKGDRVLNGQCKVCINLKRKKSYNKEKHSLYRKKHYIKNKNKKREYRLLNISKIRERERNRFNERYHTEPNFKLKTNIRRLIALKIQSNGYTKRSRTYQILGCSFEDFKQHIESKWLPWMNWDNYGLYNGELNYGWDIDHIIPTSSAKTEEGVIALNHYTNLQPLCSRINRDIKRNLIPNPQPNTNR
jgi:hypothetical protein